MIHRLALIAGLSAPLLKHIHTVLTHTNMYFSCDRPFHLSNTYETAKWTLVYFSADCISVFASKKCRTWDQLKLHINSSSLSLVAPCFPNNVIKVKVMLKIIFKYKVLKVRFVQYQRSIHTNPLCVVDGPRTWRGETGDQEAGVRVDPVPAGAWVPNQQPTGCTSCIGESAAAS